MDSEALVRKPKVAVHKFASCDGCQLALLNLGEDLLQLSQLVEFAHFAELGVVDPEATVDVAFIEGSISTQTDVDRIQLIRAQSRYLITIGACATAGGLQALRNLADGRAWLADVYATPAYVDSMELSTAVAQHVKVDLELWGCPVNGRQVVAALRALLDGVPPLERRDKVCMDCKRSLTVCVMVTRGLPCMGPVTRTGCGALCPRFGRDCYACYGPSEAANSRSLARRFDGLGLLPDAISRRFLGINNAAAPFTETGLRWKAGHD